jgi:hypothetical protein
MIAFMRKIIVQEFITLDGFIEDANDSQMSWVTNRPDKEMETLFISG